MEKFVCRICGSFQHDRAYFGPIRDGIFGKLRQDASVYKCLDCGVEVLEEDMCPDSSFYETEEYREKLSKGLDSQSYFVEHDTLQIHTIKAIWPRYLRNSVVADIGCGGGALLDHLRGWSKDQVAIEPYDVYRRELAANGYKVFPYAVDAMQDWKGKIDLALSVQVIEHTENPRDFLSEIRPLLSDEGRLIVSTPNRDDILFDLLPDEFPEFFYRVVHRWYFNASSLRACANRAGFEIEEIKYSHRYNLGNALRWLRDKKPTGNVAMDGIDQIADVFWSGYLEQAGKSDCMYAILRAK
jgi:2-polyprenyl-3-methyl-5-hydroxy-6-metoxy-1,4-benzoquinol methylase